MDKSRLFKKPIPLAYETNNALLIHSDTFEALEHLADLSVDLIFADPPYFLSNGGISCQAGKQVSVNKGKWDEGYSFEEKHEFNRRWLRACKRVLKPNGTIWISGTFHNIFSVGYALEQEGYKIINNVTWQKTNPPPNLACRCFTQSTETVLWAKKADKKSKHIFHYELMKQENGGKQMKDVWTGSLTQQKEKKFGKHPTQKPLYLLERIIRCSSNEGDVVLDPFCGSSTTGVASIRLGRNYVGIDNEIDFINLSCKRLEAEQNGKEF